MCADELVYILAEHEVAYLAVSLDALWLEAMNRVPKSDATVSCTTAAHQ